MNKLFKISLCAAAAFALAIASTGPLTAHADETGDGTVSVVVTQSIIDTDKNDYAPTEWVRVIGTAFQSLQNLVLKVFGASVDGNPDFSQNFSVAADASGSFAYPFQLDGIYRPNYTVNAFDAGDLTASLAQTSFTDTVHSFITFTSSGLSSDASGTVLTIDGTAYTYYDLNPTGGNTLKFNWIVGETHTVVKTSSVSSSVAGKHYDFSSWTSGDGLTSGNTYTVPSSNTSVTANYAAVTGKATPSIATTASAGGAIGTQIHDVANVTGGSNPTGTVTFKLYDVGDATCSGTEVFTSADIVLASGSATSGNFTAVKVGTYRWIATYNGDANNYSVSSNCSDEAVVITKTSPTLATTIKDAAEATVNAVPLGTTVHDTAVLSGGYGPTGNISYTFFGNGACDGSGIAAGTGVSSDNEGPLSVGSYSFKAHFAGDSNNNAADSACEPLTVAKAQALISTAINDDSNDSAVGTVAALGTTIYDTASLSGKVGTTQLTGTVTYDFFSTIDCTGLHADQTVTIGANSTVPDSANQGPLQAGPYSFIAIYSGDGNYLGNTGACEAVTINKAQLGISTTVYSVATNLALAGNLSLGGGAYDKGVVTGKVDSFVIPNVTFYFFGKGVACANGNIAGGTALNSVVPAGSGLASPSTSETGLAAGTYNFMAVIVGNDNYIGATSNCEPFTVDKTQLAITTEAHNSTHTDITNGSVALGSIVHDTAAVAGGVYGFDLPGVTFTETTGYTGTCDSGNAVDTTATVDAGNGDTGSVDSPALMAGEYAFRASVAGNDNYIGDDSGCEAFTVNKGDTTSATAILNAANQAITYINKGETIHDKLTVTGMVSNFEINGTAAFTLYKGGSCAGDVVNSWNTQTVTNGIAESGTQTINDLGVYSFKAVYSGNSNYNGSTAVCEPLYVVGGAVTRGECTFDVDKSDNDQDFKLIFTPQLADSSFKLSASNPGQFFYDVFTAGTDSVIITLPKEFVTQGANPIHVYSDVSSYDQDGFECFARSGEVSGFTVTPNIDGTITVGGLGTGFSHIVIHIDFGAKSTTGYLKGGTSGLDASKGTDTIKNETQYKFEFSAGGSPITTTIENENVFKKDPGIGGIVTSSADGTPVPGVKVEIWQGNNKLATLTTDADGWYMWAYKYTGKAATFTVKVGLQSLTTTLKSNGFAVVPFIL